MSGKEQRNVTVSIDSFSEKDQAKCWGCSARGTTYRGQIPIPFCQLAQLEKRRDRTLITLADARRAHINATKIPQGCPNGYKNPWIRIP